MLKVASMNDIDVHLELPVLILLNDLHSGRVTVLERVLSIGYNVSGIFMKQK